MGRGKEGSGSRRGKRIGKGDGRLDLDSS